MENGSEKQIKWAYDLLKNFNENTANKTEKECLTKLEDDAGFPEYFSYDAFKIMTNIIKAQTSAKWWIKNMRGEKFSDIIMLAENYNQDDFYYTYNIYN